MCVMVVSMATTIAEFMTSALDVRKEQMVFITTHSALWTTKPVFKMLAHFHLGCSQLK